MDENMHTHTRVAAQSRPPQATPTNTAGHRNPDSSRLMTSPAPVSGRRSKTPKRSQKDAATPAPHTYKARSHTQVSAKATPWAVETESHRELDVLDYGESSSEGEAAEPVVEELLRRPSPGHRTYSENTTHNGAHSWLVADLLVETKVPEEVASNPDRQGITSNEAAQLSLGSVRVVSQELTLHPTSVNEFLAALELFIQRTGKLPAKLTQHFDVAAVKILSAFNLARGRETPTSAGDLVRALKLYRAQSGPTLTVALSSVPHCSFPSGVTRLLVDTSVRVLLDRIKEAAMQAQPSELESSRVAGQIFDAFTARLPPRLATEIQARLHISGGIAFPDNVGFEGLADTASAAIATIFASKAESELSTRPRTDDPASQLWCHTCKRSTHRTSECRFASRSTRSTGRTEAPAAAAYCTHCRRSGHTLSECRTAGKRSHDRATSAPREHAAAAARVQPRRADGSAGVPRIQTPAMTNSSSTAANPAKCYNCQQPGHITTQCTHPCRRCAIGKCRYGSNCRVGKQNL